MAKEIMVERLYQVTCSICPAYIIAHCNTRQEAEEVSKEHKNSKEHRVYKEVN